MRSGRIPFQFDLNALAGQLHRLCKSRVGNVTISLPFVSFSVSPKNREKQIAREIVIRLKDRRVLSAWECCDDCIDKALSSLQEIRRFLVDKQVDLSEFQDGPLYMIIEVMALGIRQFLTFEEHLRNHPKREDATHARDFYRDVEVRQAYFDALEILRGHLSRCLRQVAAIAGTDFPKDGLISQYVGEWPGLVYEPLQLTDRNS
jgi:hypothetical protein